jgi:hypothetical protein
MAGYQRPPQRRRAHRLAPRQPEGRRFRSPYPLSQEPHTQVWGLSKQVKGNV